MRRIYRLIAKLILKLLPDKPIEEDLNKRPEETPYEYQQRVPLMKQPVKDTPTISYLGKEIKNG